jgi:hypothetical protein
MVVPYAPGEDARFCCRADSKVKPKNVGIDKLSEPLPFREYHPWEVDVLSFLRNYGSRCSPWTDSAPFHARVRARSRKPLTPR